MSQLHQINQIQEVATKYPLRETIIYVCMVLICLGLIIAKGPDDKDHH